MSDLSTQLALSTNNTLASLRSNDKGSEGNMGTDSFSSVLNERVARQNDKEASAESSAGSAASATPANPSSPSPATKSASKDGEAKHASKDGTATTDDSDTASTEVPDGSPIATVLMQLFPSAVATPTTSEASTAQGSSINLSLLQGAGKGRANKDLPDTTHSESSANASDMTGQTLTTELGQAPAEGTPALPKAAADVAATAIAAEAESSTRAKSKGAGESDFGQLLAQAQENSGQSHATATHASQRTDSVAHMETPAGHPNWANELGDKMTWMVTSQKQQAELVLNPPQLGRIEVSLTISGDQANAVFTSPNAAVRDMIENSLPRLREIMSSSGMNLGQADVGAQSFGQQQQANSNGNGNSSGRPGLLSEGLASRENPLNSAGSMNLGRPGARNGLVDIFA